QVVRRYGALDELRLLVLALPQIFHGFGAEVLIEAQELNFRLADLGLCFGDGRCDLSALAFEAGHLALQARQPRHRRQSLGEEILDAGELVRNELYLGGLGFGLGIEPGDLLAQLLRLALQQLLLAVTRKRSGLEQRPLRGQKVADARVAGAPSQT